MKYIISIIFFLLIKDGFSNDVCADCSLGVKDYELFVLKERSASFIKLYIYNRGKENITLKAKKFIFSFNEKTEEQNRIFRENGLALIYGGCGADAPPLWTLISTDDNEVTVNGKEELVLFVHLVEYVNQAFFSCKNKMQLEIYIRGRDGVVLKFYVPLSREKIKFCDDCVYGNSSNALNCRSCIPGGW